MIGEAVKNLSPAHKDAHQEIPWKRVAGLRDVLIHGYFGVKLETVWDVVDRELPAFRAAIEQMLGD